MAKSQAIQTTEFIQALQKNMPGLSPAETTRLGNVVLGEISNRLNAGEQLAFLRRNPDGTSDLTVYSWALIKKMQGGK